MNWRLNQAKFFLILCFLFIFVSSCRTHEKITKTVILEEQIPAFLIQKLHENEFHFEWLNAKANVDVLRNKESFNFSVSLRMRKDSAIWASISPGLGIEAVRVLITKDSVKLMDKVGKRFWLSDFKYLNQLFHVPVTFDMIQSVIIGNYFSYQDETKPRSSYVDNQYYLISNLLRKKKLRSEEDIDLTKKIIQDVWLSPENYRIAASVTDDKKEKLVFEVRYRNFKLVENLLFPFQCNIVLKGENKYQISIEYSKVTINKELEFPFHIPDNYEKIR